MKTTTIAALALAALVSPLAAAEPAPKMDGLRGRYLEGRTASVFAGACHFGSEFTTNGREALVAWNFESGTVDGVSLEGLTLAAAIVADTNLAAEGSQHRSVLFVPAGLDAARKDALLAWAKAEHGELFGKILEVRESKVAFAMKKDHFDVAVGENYRMKGDLLADRACCAMSHDVWYTPFDDGIAKPIVGGVDEFRGTSKRLGRKWNDSDVNCVFFGRFGAEKAQG